MAWGTEFNANMQISRTHFKNITELDYEIEKVTSDIASNERLILMYTCSSPKKVVPKDWADEPVQYLKTKVEELLNEIEEQTVYLFKLELLKENFNIKKEY